MEIIDGQAGSDTLYTPVPLAALQAAGAIVINIENVVITDQRYLSECY